MSVKMPDVFEDAANAVTLTGSHWFLKKRNGRGIRERVRKRGGKVRGVAGQPVLAILGGNILLSA